MGGGYLCSKSTTWDVFSSTTLRPRCSNKSGNKFNHFTHCVFFKKVFTPLKKPKHTLNKRENTREKESKINLGFSPINLKLLRCLYLFLSIYFGVPYDFLKYSQAIYC